MVQAGQQTRFSAKPLLAGPTLQCEVEEFDRDLGLEVMLAPAVSGLFPASRCIL